MTSSVSSFSGPTPAFGDFNAVAKNYVQRVVARCVSGAKILLVDSEVVKFLNVTFTHSQLLSHEIFVIDELRKADRAPMKFFHCVIFVRPTQENFQAITAELERGNFQDYYLFFTNMFGIDEMQFLVRSDRFGKVRHCEEVYLDMFPVTNETCIIPLVTPAQSAGVIQTAKFVNGQIVPVQQKGPPQPLLRNPITINQWDNSDLLRVTEGIVAMALASARRPHIRYRANNRVCSHIASALGSRARNLRHRFYDLSSKECVLLILDRLDDPITPLVTPWTYQALCHELLGIDSGIVTTVTNARKAVDQSADAASSSPAGASSATPAGTGTGTAGAGAGAAVPGTAAAATAAGGSPSSSAPATPQYVTVKEETQHVLSAESDSFFRANRDATWGELCLATKGLVDAFLELNKIDLKTKSLAEIGEVKSRMPEMRLQNILADRHSTIVSEMGRLVKSRQLLSISVLEQDLVCGSLPALTTDFASYAKRFLDAIGDRQHVSDADALRIAILFEIRFENRRDTAVSGSIRALLRKRAVDTRLLDAVLQLGGTRARAATGLDLFPQDKKSSSGATNAVKGFFHSVAKALKEFGGDSDSVSNVVVRHTPHLQSILAAAARGSLSETAFPYYGEGNTGEGDESQKSAAAAASSADGGGGAAAASGGSGSVGVERPKEIIVFVVGGVTYSEALLVKKINEATAAVAVGNPSRYVAAAKKKKTRADGTEGSDESGGDDDEQNNSDKIPPELVGCRVLLGSTSVLSSRRFLESLPMLQQ